MVTICHYLDPQVNDSDVNLEEGSCCWETVIGQELYKLSLTHLLADMAGVALVDGCRWLIGKFKPCERAYKWVSQLTHSKLTQLLNDILSENLQDS